MKNDYIRFVVGGSYKGAESQYGVLAEIAHIMESEDLESYEADFCRDLFDWLNEFLPEPPFDEKRWPKRAVSWLKTNQKDLIRRFREAQVFLDERGIATTVVYSSKPGMKLYEDEYQIVAIPN